MKKMICFIALILSYFLLEANTLPSNNVNDTVPQQIQQNVERTVNSDTQDTVNSLTLAINAINNIQTWSAVIIAILTLIVALWGIFGYRRMKKNIKENIKKNDKIIRNRIEAINAKEQEFNDCITKITVVIEKLNSQEKYMCKANQYLYEALDKIANQIPNADTGKAILQNMLHNYQITNLYSTDNNTKFAALAYLYGNGTLEDIEHLEYFAKSNIDERNREWAREIVGIIKHKTSITNEKNIIC